MILEEIEMMTAAERDLVATRIEMELVRSRTSDFHSSRPIAEPEGAALLAYLFPKPPPRPQCATVGCDRPRSAKGLCKRCYDRSDEHRERRRARRRRAQIELVVIPDPPVEKLAPITPIRRPVVVSIERHSFDAESARARAADAY